MDGAVYGFAASKLSMLPERALVCSVLILLEEKGVFRFAKIAPYGNQLQR